MIVYGEMGEMEGAGYEDPRRTWLREPPQQTPLEIAAGLAIRDAEAFAATQPFLSRNLARAACVEVPLPLWVRFDGGGDCTPREKTACYLRVYARTLLVLTG